MINRQKMGIAITVLLSVFFVSCFAQAELAVIMRADSDIETLSTTQIVNIFLRKRERLPNGSNALPVDQPKGEFRDQFYLAFTGKNRARISEYWAKRLITETGTPAPNQRP